MDTIEGVTFTDTNLIPIWEKVLAGERLTRSDGLQVLETSDLSAIGRMADFAKVRQQADRVYFVLNRHLNPTNVCVLTCSFCDFAKKKGDSGAYEMTMDEMLSYMDPEIREVHIVGGLSLIHI